MDPITVPASKENLADVLEFIRQKVEAFPHQDNALLQLELSVEEAYVNIASYAYPEESGEITVGLNIDENPLIVTVELIDTGIRFNPLEKEEPDISMEIDDKKPGGLGILLLKENADQVHYQYLDGRNILTIQKRLD